mgnify:CR=1 FL=1
MMKLTQIEAWATPDGRHTRLRRYYDNPGMKHIVALHPHKVVTYLDNDDTPQAFKAGIHHRIRP